ncbi:MAG: hypothetical protein GY854_26530 [Deltaproteobacteria bacterium]|nr:hypothetical protein [Deltaproteobacteria bacterium]
MSRAIRMLLAKGQISREQYEQAVLLQAREGGTIGCYLVRTEAIGDGELVDFLTENFQSAHWKRAMFTDLDMDILARVGPDIARDLRILPLAQEENRLILGLTDPSRTHVIEEAAYHTGAKIVPVIISENDMTWALSHYYKNVELKDVKSIDVESTDEKPTDAESKSEEDPVLRVSNGVWNMDRLELPGAKKASESIFEKTLAVTDSEDKELLAALERAEAARADDSPTRQSQQAKPDITVRAPIKVGPTSQPTSTPSRRPKNPHSLPSPAPRALSEGEIISAIHKAPNRNEIVDLALEYLRHFAERAAFFIVKKKEIRGYEIAGDMTSRSAIRSFWIPLASKSTLQNVVVERHIHLGPHGRNPADAILAAALGGRPKRVLVIPVEISGQVIGLLYADNLSINMPPWNRLERLSEVVGDNLKRLFLNKETR